MKKVLRLDEVLKEKHLQQKDLAEKLGVSKVSVSYWCNNQTNPSIDKLVSIAKVLEVKVSELIYEEK
jgi:transcriptional regulator with XRE-family HTH domain